MGMGVCLHEFLDRRNKRIRDRLGNRRVEEHYAKVYYTVAVATRFERSEKVSY